MNWEELNETQQGACRALAEIVADNGASFAIEALAEAVDNDARTSSGNYGDNLAYTVAILRQLAAVLENAKE